MNLRSGIPLITDLDTLQSDPLYQEHVTWNNAFLQKHGKALEGYGKHWGQNPFAMWSRRWEYPYVIQKVLDWAKQTGQGDGEANAGAAGPGSSAGDTGGGDAHRPLRMLDGGSGVTYVPFYLTEKLPILSVICCDTDTSYVPMFEAINRNSAHHRVSFAEAMLQKLPYDDDALDVVACISVLEHTDNYGQIIAEFARVLRPGGLLVLTFDLSLDGKFTLNRETAAELLGAVEKDFDIRELADPQAELKQMQLGDVILSTDHVKRTNPELLPWRYPLLKGLHDLATGHGWTGGFRSKAVYCLDAVKR